MAVMYSKMDKEIARMRLMMEGALIGALIAVAITIIIEFLARVKSLNEKD